MRRNEEVHIVFAQDILNETVDVVDIDSASYPGRSVSV